MVCFTLNLVAVEIVSLHTLEFGKNINSKMEMTASTRQAVNSVTQIILSIFQDQGTTFVCFA